MAISSWQLPRVTMIWLLLAQMFVIAPFLRYLPVWLLLSYFICVYWRFLIFKGRLGSPNNIAKALVVILGFGMVKLTCGSLIGLEATTSLLIVGLSLKLIECKEKRDCLLLSLLCFLLLAVSFLYNQSLFHALYVVVCVPLVTTAMQSLHFSLFRSFDFRDIGKSFVILFQALPLMVVLFLVFPRFDPIWQINLPSQQAKVGVSDILAPGDFGKLTKDSSIAFRATFDGPSPNKDQLYWRGIVLSHYDGRVWHRDQWGMDATNRITDNKPHEKDQQFQYRIIQEPNNRSMLFSLAVADSNTYGVQKTADYLLSFKRNVFERIAYDVTSNITTPRQLELSDWQFKRFTRLGGNTNPRSRLLAKQWYERAEGVQDFIGVVLSNYVEQEFYYSLDVPKFGAHAVDEFLFDTRTGYCGHYASSFVYMMRAAGIPARVVGGYLGGEINPLTSTILVHQFDAHAWAEVWIEGLGWQRVDPTLQVAPSRILNSVNDLPETATQFQANLPMSVMQFKHISWVNYLRLRLDALDYHWASKVLQYKGDNQYDFLLMILGQVTALRILLMLLFAIMPFVIWWLLKLAVTRVRNSPGKEERSYNKLCLLLAGSGMERGASEGPIDYIQRIESQRKDLPAGLLSYLQEVTRIFVALRYEQVDSQQRKLMVKQLSYKVGVAERLLIKWKRAGA